MNGEDEIREVEQVEEVDDERRHKPQAQKLMNVRFQLPATQLCRTLLARCCETI